MKTLISLTAFLVPFILFSQSAGRLGRTNTDTLPANFKLSTIRLRDHIYNGIPPKLKNERYPRASFRFADQASVQLSGLFSSGRVYSDWPAFEKYVNQVLARVIPPELAGDSVIHAYLVKDAEFNAFMTPSGILFVHIGLFDEIPTEAALAGVITHELAHYYLRHSLMTYVKAERGEFDRVFNRKSASKFSVQNELQADSLAIIWMQQSGYGTGGIRETMTVFKNLDNRILLHFENLWEIPETTHPMSERRVAQVDSFARKHPEQPGSVFLVSRESFYTFRELAKSEILKSLLYAFDYDGCIEKAFKYHILNPNRAEYIYYLMEGIRRKCYFNVDHWKEKFITENYYQVVPTKTGRKKEKMTDHIFKAIPQEILGLSDEEVKDLPGKFYWEGEVKFENYEEAFNFFAQVGEVLKSPECTLSNALSLGFNPEMREKALKQYLSYDKIQFRDYATQLLNGTIQSALPDKTLTVLSDFYATVKQGDEEIYIRNEKLVEDNNLTPLLQEAVSGFERRQYVNLSELRNKNINDYSLLRELRLLALLPIVAKGVKTELHILDPRYWQIMQKYQVNEMEFIDFNYYDARKADSSLESYKEIVQTDYNTLLSEVKRNRYIETRIASIRIMPKSNMKITHYGVEEKIDYNKPAREPIIEYIRENLKAKDKIAKQFDGKQE